MVEHQVPCLVSGVTANIKTEEGESLEHGQKYGLAGGLCAGCIKHTPGSVDPDQIRAVVGNQGYVFNQASFEPVVVRCETEAKYADVPTGSVVH